MILRGSMSAKDRTAALDRLHPQPGGPPLLAAATGPYAGEGFDCPALDILFLAAPVAQKGRLVQYAGRILRPYDGKTTAEVYDYHDELTGVLASFLAKRAPGYTSGTHYLRMSKKDLVEAAVEFYLNARREEMQALAHLFHAKTPIDLMSRAHQAVLRYPLGSLGRFVTAATEVSAIPSSTRPWAWPSTML